MTKEKVMDNETAELPTFGSIFEYLDYNIDIFGQNGELSYYFDYNDDEDYEEGRLESASIDYEYDIYEYNINDAETAFAKFKNLYKKLKQEYETVIGTDIDTQVTIYQSYNVSPLLSEDYELTFTPDSHVAYAKETTTIESILSDENMPLVIDYLTRTKETDPSYEASMTFYIFITLSVHDNRFFQMYISKRCNTPTVAISLQYGTYAGLEHMENNIPYIWK